MAANLKGTRQRSNSGRGNPLSGLIAVPRGVRLAMSASLGKAGSDNQERLL